MSEKDENLSIDDILREYEAMSKPSEPVRPQVTVEPGGDQVWRPANSQQAHVYTQSSSPQGKGKGRGRIVHTQRSSGTGNRKHQQNSSGGHSKKGSKGRGKTLLATVLLVVLLCMGCAVGYTYATGTIFYGVKAGTVEVGGLSLQEAQRKIEQDAQVVQDAAISVKIYDTPYEIAISEVTDGLDTAASAQAAFDIGHKGNLIERMRGAFGALIGQRNVDLVIQTKNDVLNQRLDQIAAEALTEPQPESWSVDGSNLILTMPRPGVQFNKEKVKSDIYRKIEMMDFTPYEVETQLTEAQPLNVDVLKTKVDTAPTNAVVDKTDGKTIIPEQVGIEIDADKAREIIGDGSQPTYTIPIKVTPAKVTKEVLSRALFRDVLASASTNLNTENRDRTSNVTLAAQKMNGTILNPGDEFSYNETVGPRTTERGFKAAGAYLNGKLIDDVGGGVCQPSSTMYMAVLRADLEVTARSNHSMTVAYTPLGQDATVSYGSIDFKFKNNTDYPIKLVTARQGSQMKVKILGTKVDDKTVRLETEILETLEPQTVEKTDASLAPGDRRVEQSAATGYKTVTYKYVTVDGKTTKEVANKSSYRKRDKLILVGQKGQPATSVGGSNAAKNPQPAPPNTHGEAASGNAASGNTDTGAAAATETNDTGDPEG